VFTEIEQARAERNANPAAAWTAHRPPRRPGERTISWSELPPRINGRCVFPPGIPQDREGRGQEPSRRKLLP
jgi:hypothetical protein